ncbi:hypothetical protein HYH03_010535 [Edaphochlamys debaryana]|uniref:Uncharacterized protein n=1 Tax=Edaphochlamys debaryana TaxID=47281 RepID=A0A835XZ47_9CHLO|nr:hypothetical protein HYH03_010535 [Edaphochlamys debaryana]|eukprot:KAG2491091.1 hypothetical protein HYH03_010535 [Edaphochlamys debaryana]
MPLAPEWQHPFVNVFKLCDVDTMKEFETKGDVTEHIDKIIGKKVFKVRGVIPASNYLRVPRSKLQTLGLTGRILYMQLKVTPVKVFVIHVEALTQDGNMHRISISNMYSQDSLKRKSNGVQIPFPKPSHRWCVVGLDLREALRGYTSSPFASIKTIQLCSWLTVRTMFTSDYRFTLQSLPSDMALSLALDSSIFEMIWLPREPRDAPTQDFMPPPKRMSQRRRTADVGSAGGASGAKGGVRPSSAGGVQGSSKQLKGAGGRGAASTATGAAGGAGGGGDDSESDDDFADDISSDHDNGTPPPPSPRPPPLSPASAAAATRRATAANLGSSTAAAVVVGPDAGSRPFPRPTTAILPGAAAPLKPALASATLGVETEILGPPLTPDPALTLLRMNAYSGEFLRCLVWVPGTDEVAYAAASVVVLMQVADGGGGGGAPPGTQAAMAPGRQRHLLGHTSFVCALAVAGDGEVLASAQEGKEATVRVWELRSGACLAVLSTHASGLSCVDISPDVRALAAVGLDAQGRQTIALWNIAELRAPSRKVELVTRHPTEYNVKVLRFSAYQEDHLLTAGRDSIRMYRLKGGQLRGTSVRIIPNDKRVTSYAGGVSAALGPNIFTDIAFEAGVGVYGVDAFKFYVSSASGAVFQVDYTTRQLDAVYQLHSAAINVLLIADGIALTGGDDRLLRAWPLDFRDYLLEAEHEGAVTGLALSPDALRVAIGTENGALGCLAIPSHAYATLLRSHCGTVSAVAVDPNRDQFCTVSSDGTLRIWHLATWQQLYEFDAPGEAVSCIAYHPAPQHHELAAGFANGRMRVFDVPSTTLLQEQQQHRAAVAELVFSPSGDRLFSGGQDGALVVYDTQRLYAPTQYLSAGVRDIKVCVAASSNGAFVASLVRDPYRSVTSLLVFHGRSLDPFMRIETDAAAYVKLGFSPDSNELWALTTGRRLDRYELKDGQLVQQIHEVSALDVTTLALDPLGRYALTAGNDGMLRLWGCVPLADLRPKGLPPHQEFLGHPSAVLGAAFHRGYLITVGDADVVCVWRVNADWMAHNAAAMRAAVAAAAVLPAPLRAPNGTAIVSSPSRGGTAGGLDPKDPRSRAHPSTALGPVASAADHRITTRAAALGTPLPANAALVPGPAASPPRPASAPYPYQAASGAVGTPVFGSTGTVIPRPASPYGAGAVSPQALAGLAPLAQAGLVRLATDTASPSVSPRPIVGPSTSPYLGPLPAKEPDNGATQPALPLPPQLQPLVPRPPPWGGPGAPPPLPALPVAPPRPPQPTPACAWLLGYSPTGCGNVVWHAESGMFAYVVEDMVVLEHLASRKQRYLRAHNEPLGCLAASRDGRLLASAPLTAETHVAMPSAAAAALVAAAGIVSSTAPFADVVVWEVATGQERWRLRYHPIGVQVVAFSPDGRWLLSLGRDPERSVVVWDIAAGLLVAAGRTEHAPSAAEWLWGGDNPAFATVSGDGLMLWTLQDSFLEQRAVPLSGAPGAPVPCTALAVDPAGAMLVAEGPTPHRGGGPWPDERHVPVWHVQVQAGPGGGGAQAAMVQVASLPADTVVTALAAGARHALVGTAEGVVVRFRRSTYSGTWAEDVSVRLDGAVSVVAAEPGMADAVVATATSTIWFVGMQDASSVPIVCGQPAPVHGLVAAPHDPRVMASTSRDGLLRVWHLGPEDAEPAVELHSTAACTAAAFILRTPPTGPEGGAAAPSGPPADAAEELARALATLEVSVVQTLPRPHLVGGYADGSLRLFTLEPAVELQWALARHPAPIVGVVPHPRRPVVLSASSDGSLAITDLNTTRLSSFIPSFITVGPRAGLAPPPPAASPRRSPGGRNQPPPPPPKPGTGPLQAFAVSPGSGASITALGWRDRFVVFPTPWDDPSCVPMAEHDVQPADGRRDSDDPYGLLSPDVPALLGFVGGATKLLAFSSPLLCGEVLVYDYRLAAVVRRVRAPQMVRSLAISPDGAALVLGGTDRAVYLVHLATGNTATLRGHSSGVTAAAFTSDGAHAVTGAGTVLMVWDAVKLMKELEPASAAKMLRQEMREFPGGM